MADEKGRTKQPMDAREWVLVVGAGVLIAVLGMPMASGSAVAVGALVAVVGVLGLLWRLTKDR